MGKLTVHLDPDPTKTWIDVDGEPVEGVRGILYNVQTGGAAINVALVMDPAAVAVEELVEAEAENV